MSDETPSLHIDSDWKAQAQAEKERLAEREAERAQTGGGEGGAGELPPANFNTLLMTLGSQAMMGLGAYADPSSGRVMIDLAGAQFAIDLLGVLEEKTKGNLTPEETAELGEILSHLRARFVQVAQLVAQQMQREATGGLDASGVAGSIGLGAAPAKPGSGGASGLIMPD
jgi:hypothetical protein